MKRFVTWILPIVLTAPISVFASGGACAVESESNEATSPTSIPMRPFFESVKGNYKIQKVNNEVPHDSNSLACVDLETAQVILTFGYCPPNGGCDPGYIFLDDDKTKVT